MRKTLTEIIASIAVLGFASSAQATALFEVDTNPSGTKLFLDRATDASSSFGNVISTDDVAISASGNADFKNGFSTIKPVKDGLLTTLTFTPTNPNAFGSFSFRGQDLDAGQVIDVIIQDNQGHAPVTITFTEGKANQDFTREGIIAAMPGETIKSIELVDSGGFKEAKQFEFDAADPTAVPAADPTAVPEPATWLMMLAGIFGLGAMTRAARRNSLKTA